MRRPRFEVSFDWHEMKRPRLEIPFDVHEMKRPRLEIPFDVHEMKRPRLEIPFDVHEMKRPRLEIPFDLHAIIVDLHEMKRPPASRHAAWELPSHRDEDLGRGCGRPFRELLEERDLARHGHNVRQWPRCGRHRQQCRRIARIVGGRRGRRRAPEPHAVRRQRQHRP
jgi:hypothetical protein